MVDVDDEEPQEEVRRAIVASGTNGLMIGFINVYNGKRLIYKRLQWLYNGCQWILMGELWLIDVDRIIANNNTSRNSEW